MQKKSLIITSLANNTTSIQYLFEEAQVILFAVKTFMSERNDFEILLNPSNSYVIKKTDVCVYIAEGPKEVQDVSTLVSNC